ncbi:hypothetical protein ACFLEY_05270 [Bradyrhizobium sp. YCK136]|uniref:hypothetical protein n=1 Tax=Bradyrhizobium sp. YCK136 TaxID=3351346 RepID=UPI0037C713A1
MVSTSFMVDTSSHPRAQLHRCVERSAYVELVNALVSPSENEPLLRARTYFAKIRRLAHIYLDLTNLPTYVQFHPAVLLQRIIERPSDFIESDSNSATRLISSLLDYLQEETYSSESANRYKLDRIGGLIESLDKSLANSSRTPASSKSRFVNWILGAKAAEFWGYRPGKLNWHHRLRLRFMSDGYFGPDKIKPLTEATRFADEVNGSHWKIFVTSYAGPQGSNCFVDLYECGDNIKRADEGRVGKALLSFIRRCYATHFRLPLVFAWISDESTSDLFRYLLSRGLPKALRLRLDGRGGFSDYSINVVDQKAKRSNWSREAAWETRRRKIHEDRAWEIECLRREVRGALVGTVMVATRAVIVEDANHKMIAELDGVFIRFNRGLLEIVVVEAKNTRKGASNQALKELTQKMEKLGVESSRIEKKEHYAVASITL